MYYVTVSQCYSVVKCSIYQPFCTCRTLLNQPSCPHPKPAGQLPHLLTEIKQDEGSGQSTNPPQRYIWSGELHLLRKTNGQDRAPNLLHVQGLISDPHIYSLASCGGTMLFCSQFQYSCSSVSQVLTEAKLVFSGIPRNVCCITRKQS